MRLLNALWRALEGALPGEGRSVAHLSKFVRDDVLGTVFQRTYRWVGLMVGVVVMMKDGVEWGVATAFRVSG